MLKRFKAIVIAIIITLLQSYFVPFGIVFASEVNPSGNETHEYIKELEIRKGSEYGELVADVLHGDAINLDLNTDYYICIRSKTPAGETDGRFSIEVGQDRPSGIQYINIPGQSYIPGTITSDAFDALVSYDNLPEPVYGSSSSKYELKDGKLVYQIKENKMNNGEIYMAYGFKIDPIYWCNENTINKAICLKLENAEGVKDSFDINVNVNGSKTMYTYNTSKTLSARANVVTTPYTLSLYSAETVPVLYDEVGVRFTFSKHGDLAAASFSGANMTSVTNGTYGNLTVSERIDNGDGTYSRYVKVGPGQKAATNISTFFVTYFIFDDKVKDGAQEKILMDDFYYIPSGHTEKIPYKHNNSADTWEITTTVANSPEVTENLTIGAVNRLPDSNWSTYSWNVGKDEDELVQAAQFISGAIIRNLDSVATHYNKTVKASYNITNENAYINAITLPVGLDADDNFYKQITVRYTGYDYDGNEVSGEAVVGGNRFGSSYPNAYVIVRAMDLGIRGFKTAEADIGRLAPGSNTSTWGGYNGYSSNTFAAYGYFADSTVGNRIKSTFEITNTDEDAPQNPLRITSSGESADAPCYTFSNDFSSGLKKENLSIVAGNSLKLNNRAINAYAIISKSSPANTSVIANPAIILKLPKGMSFSELSFSKCITNVFRYNDTKEHIDPAPLEYTVENISYLNKTEDGTNIYKITFNDKSLVIGTMVNDDLDNVKLYMSIRLSASKNVTTQVYDFNELFNITSEVGGIAGSYSQNSQGVPDIYGINDGNNLGGTRKKDATVTGISVQRLDSITVDNAISIESIEGVEVDPETRTWDTYDESNQNSISYMGLHTTGQYRIKIENPSTSTAYGLKMIVPIPKKGEYLGSAFTKAENQFDMTLTPSDIKDYSYKYIHVNNPVAVNSTFDTISYDEVSESEANAILITKDEVEASANDYLYFDFEVNAGEGVTGGDFNSWRNNFEYKLDNAIQTGSGSYVASEIAICTITGVVFNDVNRNNRKDNNEDVMEGISVVVTDSFGRVQFATTDENGRYKFENVREDDVSLAFEIKEGAYIFAGTPDVNGENEIYNNVTVDDKNSKKSSASIRASGEEVNVNASVNKVYTITYNVGVGSGTAPKKQECLEGDSVVIATPPSGMIVTGAEFVGWSKEKLSTSDDNREKIDYRAGDIIQVEDDMTLYAAYCKRDLKITFDYRGGGVFTEVDGELVNTGLDFKYVRNGAKYRDADKDGKTFPANPTKEGWVFAKWELPNAQYGSGTEISSGSTVNIDDDTVIRAVWVALNKNEGTIDTKVLESATLDEPFLEIKNGLKVQNMPTNYGFNFTIDNESELPEGMLFDNDTGAIYGTPVEGCNKKLNVTVKVYRNAGKTSFFTFSYTVNLKVATQKISLLNEVDPLGNITLNEGSGEIKLKSTITGLKNEKKINVTNTVKFKAVKEDGTEIEIGNAVVGENNIANINWGVSEEDLGKYTISVEVPGLDKCYEISSNNKIESYVISERELENYTVIFNPNGYDINGETRVYSEGTNYGELPEANLEGYTFLGWFNGIADDSIAIESSQEVERDITLYAKFVKKEYTVKYSTGINTEIEDKLGLEFYSNNLIPSNELTRDGYTFLGWYLGNTKVDKAVKYSELVANDDVLDVTLTAKWQAKQYNITLVLNGGSIGTNKLLITYLEEYGELDKPLKQGYDFIGWEDETGHIIVKTDKYLFTKDTTLNAKWAPKTGYAINYNTNEGNAIAPITNTNWEKLVLEDINNPTREGAEFVNWTYNNKPVTNTDTYGALAQNDKLLSITLNAVWNVHKYNVNLSTGTGYTLINTDRLSEVEYNGSYTFEVKFLNGFVPGNNFKVTVNDVEVQLDNNNKFVITNIKENKSVVVYGVEDIRMATGTISDGNIEWETRNNDITYDIFYNQNKEITIESEFVTGSLPIVEYYILKDSNGEINENEFAWEQYNDSIIISDEGKYVVYAKIQAENGNISIINSQGFIIDKSLPTINNIEDNKTYCNQKTITISDDLSGIDKVLVNDVEITKDEDGKYTLPTDGQAIIKISDKAGNMLSLNVTLNAEHSYALNETVNPTCTVAGKKVYKCSVCNHIKEEPIEATGHTYGEEWIIDVEATCTENYRLSN